MKIKQQLFTVIINLIILNFFVGTSWANVCVGYYTIDDVDTSADITALSDCTEIDGGLTIQNTTLTNLNGLENIILIDNDLVIQSNNNLTSLSGLENINCKLCFVQLVRFKQHNNKALQPLRIKMKYCMN